jgi:hypothetical protein
MKCFLDITQLLTQDLLKPVYAPPWLKSYLQKFDVRLHELLKRPEGQSRDTDNIGHKTQNEHK